MKKKKQIRNKQTKAGEKHFFFFLMQKKKTVNGNPLMTGLISIMYIKWNTKCLWLSECDRRKTKSGEIVYLYLFEIVVCILSYFILC